MRRPGMGTFVVLFMRDLKNLALNPLLTLYNTLFPFMLILVLGYLASGNYGGGGITSYDYYGVTLLIYSVFNVATTAANGFMERKVKRANLRILNAPVLPSFVYVSKVAATFIFTSACFSLLVGVLSVTLGVRFGGEWFGAVASILLFFNLLSSTIGVMFCCIFRSEEVTNKVISPVINLLGLIGGLLFPVDGLSRTVEQVSWLSPVKWVAEAIFRLIYDQDPALFLPVMLVLAGLTVVALVGCKLTFRMEDYV